MVNKVLGSCYRLGVYPYSHYATEQLAPWFIQCQPLCRAPASYFHLLFFPSLPPLWFQLSAAATAYKNLCRISSGKNRSFPWQSRWIFPCSAPQRCWQVLTPPGCCTERSGGCHCCHPTDKQKLVPRLLPTSLKNSKRNWHPKSHKTIPWEITGSRNTLGLNDVHQHIWCEKPSSQLFLLNSSSCPTAALNVSGVGITAQKFHQFALSCLLKLGQFTMAASDFSYKEVSWKGGCPENRGKFFLHWNTGNR